MPKSRLDILQELRFVAEQSQQAISAFEKDQLDSALVKLINLRAAATVAKQDIETMIKRQQEGLKE